MRESHLRRRRRRRVRLPSHRQHRRPRLQRFLYDQGADDLTAATSPVAGPNNNAVPNFSELHLAAPAVVPAALRHPPPCFPPTSTAPPQRAVQCSAAAAQLMVTQ
ncbi:hypothetical protein KSP39_PZI017555 [Platanthera zijinensis]|uniref:Uncharacterized protein n=1 Tax=Platanthera zijinensis TaxID=2320716 RepID=A0AAP0B5X5_9ASPA